MKSNLICILLSLLFSFSLAAQQLSDTEVKIQELGFVDIRKKDPSIVVDMMYAKADNFVGVVMYKDLHTAYLHPLAASSLIKAHQE